MAKKKTEEQAIEPVVNEEVKPEDTVKIPPILRKFDYEEELMLARSLRSRHAIFNKFWSISRPYFSNALPTAGVYFNKNGECVDFLVNPEFWETLSLEEKSFVAAHECLHVLLFHGKRGRVAKDGEKVIANVAMDLVVNHMLIDKFGYDEDVIMSGSLKTGAFLNTIRKQCDLTEAQLPPNKSFEFYFNVLRIKAKQIGNQFGFDSHEGLDSCTSDKLQDYLRKAIASGNYEEMQTLKDFFKKLEEGDMKDMKSNSHQAGTEGGAFWKEIKLEKIVKKRKWEEIIRNWVQKVLSYREEEQWARTPRRMATFTATSDLMLPSDMETEEFEREKMDVWLFLDTSGSCAHLGERFIKAARSIPNDKFNVRAFCFDTAVYEIDLNVGKLYGFGGTSFTCIEKAIQKICKKEERGYPNGAIMVCTDGAGDKVVPEFPKRWIWLLTDNYRECIPPESEVHDLQKYE